MIARARDRALRIASVALLVVVAMALASAPARAKVIHHVEANFSGGAASLGGDLIAASVDSSGGASGGDVYVLESKAEGAGGFAVAKFTANGTYTGLRITGNETAPGSFEFSPFFSGVAVDSSLSVNSGDVSVSDTEHGVVDRLNENGEFVCQIAGHETEEKMPSAKECDGSGSGLSGTITPAGLAVDSSGDVYVANDAASQVDEFGAGGNFIRAIEGEGHLSSQMTAIAIDSSGDLYVTILDGSVLELNNTGTFQREIGTGSFGVAVNRATSPNEVYVDESTTLSEYEPSGALRSATTLTGGASFFPGLAVNPGTGNVYAASAGFFGEEPHGVDVVGPDIVLPNVATEAATGVEESGAVLHARVEPDLSHGGGDVTSCSFEYVTEKQFQENGYAGAATAECNATKPLPYAEAENVTAKVSLASSTTYHYRVAAADAEFPSEVNDGAGEPQPEATVTTPGAPVVEAESAEAKTASATLTAQINPFGFASTCEVQLVSEAEFVASGFAGARTLACPHTLEAGFSAQSVSVVVTGLSAGGTYHYRFVASNKMGSTNGADHTFASFAIQSFTFETLDAEGHPYTQAGGHPYVLRTSFALSRNGIEAQANVKDVETQLPPGLIGDPTALATCTRSQLTAFQCPGAAQVGLITLQTTHGGAFFEEPLYNLLPPAGVPAEFGTRFNTFTNIYIDSNVRTGGDYGVTARVRNASAATGVVGATVELWGVPAAASHNAQRKCPPPPGQVGEVGGPSCTAGTELVPFLREPTSCGGGELSVNMSVDSWQDAGAFVSRTAPLPAVTGCALPSFTPSLSLSPSTVAADSPSGLGLNLTVPQEQAPTGLGEADLKSSSIALPEGVAADPSAAAGLQACSPAQIALTSPSEPSCPEASKIGTVEIETPLLADVVKGSVYVAEQDNNPFKSLLAIYVVAQADGALVKLAGHVEANQETGQLTTTFENLPQLPFSDLRLNLFGGPRGVLVTPEACGTFSSASSWGPWSAIAPVDLASPFSVSTGCVSGFAPSFAAGVSSTQAGSYSPLVLSFSRSDSEQQPSGVSVTLPPGLLARIAGVPLCPEAEANAGDGAGGCPANTQIGTVSAAAGAGPSPIVLPGKIYLTGRYKGAPYGESVVVPAIAGPYDLGDVVVRGQIRIDPATAQATVLSEPFPTILQGIPVKLRSVQVSIDRPAFVFNPTSCDPMALTGVLHSTGGLTAAVSSRFQVADCAGLAFEPKLSVSTLGKASKLNGASLKFMITYPKDAMGSQSWMKEMKFDIPKQLPARLTTLQKACVAHVFETERQNCPAASIIGHVLVHTPVLPVPLEGPLYFVSYGGAAFPDAVAVLKGDGITIESHGHTFIDNKTGVTSATFEAVPDVPFESIEVTVPQGRYSEFGANLPHEGYDFCGEHLKMPILFKAQNGAEIHAETPVAVTGCPPSVSISKTRMKANSLLVTVKLGSGGTVKITGKGLKAVTKKGLKAGTHTITVPLTQAGRAAGRHGSKLTLRVTLTASGATGTATKTLKA